MSSFNRQPRGKRATAAQERVTVVEATLAPERLFGAPVGRICGHCGGSVVVGGRHLCLAQPAACPACGYFAQDEHGNARHAPGCRG